jgi:hypothetical protein
MKVANKMVGDYNLTYLVIKPVDKMLMVIKAITMASYKVAWELIALILKNFVNLTLWNVSEQRASIVQKPVMLT